MQVIDDYEGDYFVSSIPAYYFLIHNLRYELGLKNDLE